MHGFPSSSHDWARVAPALAEGHSLLLFDFLGFGASEKPVEHDYSLLEQADLVEALWRHEGITSTVLVAHDYAVSVAEELLATPRERSARDRAVRRCICSTAACIPTCIARCPPRRRCWIPSWDRS